MERWSGWFAFDPIAVAGGEIKVGVVLEAELYRVQAGVGGLGMEAEHVAVGDVVGDGLQIMLHGFGVFEVEVLSAGQFSYCFGDVVLQAIHAGENGYFGERERRQQETEAVIGLVGDLFWGSAGGGGSGTVAGSVP